MCAVCQLDLYTSPPLGDSAVLFGLPAAVDSVEEDHNGDVLLLAYLLSLLQQDLRARLHVRRGRGPELHWRRPDCTW